MTARLRSALDIATNLAIVVATGLAIVLFVKREGYFRSEASPVLRPASHLILSRAEDWPVLLTAGRRIGPEGAPIRVVEFADFECPYCARFHRSMKEVSQHFGDSISLSFIHFPLPYHRFAIPAAKAAECAGSQGKFSEMHDSLYEKQDSLGLKSFESFAKDATVMDSAGFSRCVARRDTTQTIRDGILAGTKFKLEGTPTILINGWMVSGGVPTTTELIELIDRSKAGTPSVGNFSPSNI